MPLSRRLGEALVDLVAPLMQDDDGRRAVVELAFGFDARLLSHVDWSGSAHAFTVRLVDHLIHHGDFEPGRPALLVLLSSIRPDVGVDKQARIDRLAADLAEVLTRPYPRRVNANVPWQLPRPASLFTGRDSDRAWLAESLSPGRVVSLTGPAGIGKSALAASVLAALDGAGELATRFPAGVVSVRMDPSGGVDAACGAIADAFDVELHLSPRDAARRALAGRRALIVVEDAESVPASQVDDLLDVLGASGALVVSRRRTDAGDDTRHLAPLDDADAVALLTGWLPPGADPGAVADVCRLVGGWPFAVRLAGRFIAATGESLPEYAQWLRESPFETLSDPDAAGGGEDGNAGLLIAHGLEIMPADALAVARVAGVLAPTDWDRAVVAAALDWPSRRAALALAPLALYGLVDGQDGRYRFSHRLIHAYAHQCLVPPDGVLPRLADHFARHVNAEVDRGPAGYRALATERPHLLAVAAATVSRADWPAALAVAAPTYAYLDYQSLRGEQIRVSELALAAARGAGDRHNEGRWLLRLAKPLDMEHRSAEAIACLEGACAIAREVGDRRLECSCLGNLGLAHQGMHRFDRAIAYYHQALEVLPPEDPRREGDLLNNLGLAYAHQGDLAGAIDHYWRAISVAQASGYRRGEAQRSGNLGLALLSDQQPDKAIAWFETALAICREIGDRANEIMWITGLARAHRALGDRDSAASHYHEAVALAGDIGDDHGLAELQEEAAAFLDSIGDKVSADRLRAGITHG